MKKDKKELILGAMEQLMASTPYTEISVDSIAKQAGIGKGSIYYYFKSKDDILYMLIDQSYRRAIREYFDSVRSRKEASAPEKIENLFRSVIKRDFGENEKNILITLNLNNDMILQSKMKNVAVQEISPVLADILAQGIREGSVKTDTPKESAEMIVIMLAYFLDDATFPHNKDDMKNKLKIFAKVLETCLQTEAGSFDFFYTSLYGGTP